MTEPEGKELSRWVVWLGIPFAASAAFFAAAIGTGAMWFMGVAWAAGPELMILAYIYLSLTSESNTDLRTLSNELVTGDELQEAACMVERLVA